MIFHPFDPADDSGLVCTCGKPRAHHADKPAQPADVTLAVDDLNVAVQHSVEG